MTKVTLEQIKISLELSFIQKVYREGGMLWLFQQSYQAVPQNTAAGIDSDVLPIMVVKEGKKGILEASWNSSVNTTTELSIPA